MEDIESSEDETLAQLGRTSSKGEKKPEQRPTRAKT
jgi:hypothetical protein